MELVTKYEDPVETPHDGYIRLGIRSHAKGTFHEYVEPGHELETAQMHRVATNKLIFNITFAWEHAVAIANENDAGKLVSHRFPQFTLSESLRPEFLKYVILDEGFHHNLYLASPGGAGRNRVLKIKEALDYPIYYPSLEEQHKIGEFITNLDHLITLHQRKLEKLKIVKKAMLENCFPKNGEKVPKFRFSGFTGDWEQRKVGDHCDMFNGDRSSKYPNTQDMVSDGVPFINAGDLEDGHVNLVNCNRITREKYDDLGGAKLQLGDIVYCLRGTLGKNSYIDNFNEGTVASSLVALRPKNIDGRYLFHVLNSDIEYKQRIVHDEGAAQPNLSAKSVSGFVIPIPDIDEQKKISKFLDGLNNLITLHQRKLEKLKIIKKSFLEKMFV